VTPNALAGLPARVILNRSFPMKHRVLRAPLRRLGAIALGLAASLPGWTQTPPTLRETVVTATRLPDTSQALPMGVSVLSAADIRASGAATVNEALMRLLGIPGRLDLFGGGEYTLDLRGFGATADSNQVVVIDGQRISEADTAGARLAVLPIDTIERIEVLRGSGAVLYGEGASGGVIVITTRAGRGTGRRNAATLYAGAGSDGLRDGRATATLAAGAFSLDASLQRRRLDGWRDNGASDTEAQSLGLQWANTWLRIGGGSAREDLDARLPGALSRADFESNPRRTNTPNDWARLRGAREHLFAQADLGGWELNADLGQRTRTLRSASGFEYDIDADTQALRARRDSRWGSAQNVLLVGHDRADWTRIVPGAFGSTGTQETRAWYVRDDLTLAGGTRLAAGLRTERIAKTDTSATNNLQDRQSAWELGASHPLSRELTVYVRAGRSFRLAKVDEFNFTTPGVPIRPQLSQDLETGARWSQGTSRAELRAWRSRLTDEIAYDPAAIGPFSAFGFGGANVNLDPTRRQGLELDAAHRLSAALGVSAHAALRSAEFRSGPYAGREVPLVPRSSLALRADWTFAPAHRVSGGVNWVSSQYVNLDNTCSVPSYTTADLRYAYQLRQAELSLGVSNLFDRRYFTQAFACAAGQATSVYPEQGRAFTAAVRMSF